MKSGLVSARLRNENRRSMFGLLGLAGFGLCLSSMCPDTARGQQCDALIAGERQKMADYLNRAMALMQKGMNSKSESYKRDNECEYQKMTYVEYKRQLQAFQQAKQACRNLKADCDVACHENNVRRVAENIRKTCSGDTQGTLAALDKSSGVMSPHSMSGSSSPAPALKSRDTGHLWSGQKADCDSASQLERYTAAWYDVCVPSAGSTTSSYVPSIPPQTLMTRAKGACGSAPTPDCMTAAKVKILMKEDPGVRQRCANAGATYRSDCVNRVYLYGPDGSDATGMRKRLIAALNKSLLDGGRPAEEPADDYAPPTGCPPGQGMKPTPGGFGSWSCQPLGTLLTRGEASEKFEHDVDEIAVDVVADAVVHLDPALPPAEQKRCSAEAAKTVRSIFTGGAPTVQAACRQLSEAARGELARFAKAHVKAYSADVEAILAGLGQHGRTRKKAV